MGAIPVAVLLYVGVAEVLIHAVPFLRAHLDMVSEHVGRQLIILAVGAWVFGVGKSSPYRIAAVRFEKVDLWSSVSLSPFTGAHDIPNRRALRRPRFCEVFLMGR